MAREVMHFDDESGDEHQGPPLRASQSGGKGKQPASKSRTSGQATDMSTLFVDENGEGITFYVQLGELSEEDIQDLKTNIREHGGIVVSSYRNADYLLVDPCTAAGVDSITAHMTPTRHVVSKDFVQESINRRKLVPHSELILFVKEDKPVVFHLHESLEEADSNRLREAIMLRGGNPNGELNDAQVVIRRADWEGDRRMKARFGNIIRLESLEWLESCIKRNRFSLRVPVDEVRSQSSKPGRKPGGPRNEFTKKDDQFLVAWIATHFGYSTAGRAGNRAYMDMMEIPEYSKWSQGHTWQSWRERYQKKKKQLDPLIEAYIAEHGTAQPGEGSDEPDPEPPVIEQTQGAYKKPRPHKRARKRKSQDDGTETDNSHHSNESYRPEKGKKAQEPEADEEGNRQDVPEKSTSSRTRPKKRARIDTSSETHVIKTSLSQKGAPLPRKPSASSKKPLPSSQKAAPASQKPTLSSQKPIASSQKAAASSQKPSQQPSSPSRSSRHSSPLDNPTPARVPSPTPPPVAKVPDRARPRATQSTATTATEESQEETQDSMRSPGFQVDAALLSPSARAAVAGRHGVTESLGGLELSRKDQEEDEEIDVGGVSQFQRPTSQGDDSLSEDTERQLAEIAEEYHVNISMVKGQFEEAVEQATAQDDAIGITRDAVKGIAKRLRGSNV
ncbi:hypothetical protein FRC10_007807 [Ceratobasidium sp. 414]|nr:hypothetical protein FRC10_007807 [Ceratobasidium sp. 414]